MTSLKIQQLDPIEHILKRPDTYVGSIRQKTSEEYIHVPIKDGKFIIAKRTIKYPPALLRIFIEALSNAIDNVQRSREVNIECTKIKIKINKETGTTNIWNDGFVIPIEKNDSSDKYKHTLIFGELRTSTNFDDTEQRVVSGRNGLGVKLLNVFSKKFTIKCVDPTIKKQLVQEWTNNMRTVSTPKITSSAVRGFTEVEWIPDFSAFGLKDGYTDDIYNLYMKYIIDASMLAKIPIFVNDTKISIKSVKEYAMLFSSPTREIVSFKGEDSEVVVSTASEFEHISFVNGVFTLHGGKHVDSWTEAIFRPIVDHFNKPKMPSVNIKDVKQFYRLFVISTLVNPEFTNQTKTELSGPDVKAIVDKKTISAILKWDHTKNISEIIKSKESGILKKTDSKRSFKADGYEPANEAGGKHSLDCTLAICEGLSARTFIVKGLAHKLFGKSGRDWLGIYPIGGKILNVIKSNSSAISENKRIKDIINILGLKIGVDYTIDANFRKLNYGKLMIVTDADTDGKHITGLIIAFIHHLFPTLLDRQEPFLVYMMTPIAKFTIGKDVKIFYNSYLADKFFSANTGKKITVDYYKGLGSNTDEDIKTSFGKNIIKYVKDEHAHASIHKAFGKDTSVRKIWLEEYDPSKYTNEIQTEMSLTEFVDSSLIEYPIDDCKRSIPNVLDGLKQSQRKILYACLIRNLKEKLKVAQLGGYVAEKTNYHHGEENLHETIIKMAQDFTGSNNINLLLPIGQHGSRSENGHDAASARYIFTCLNKITRSIFMEDDDKLLERVIEDGDPAEPIFYMPIIPMILINGASGIGMAWSTSIPMYNPRDVIKLVRDWIKYADGNLNIGDIRISILDEITPWYKNFKGVIRKIGNVFVSEGVIKRLSAKKIEITEVPIGMSIQACKETLDNLKDDKKIKSYKNYSSANDTSYIVDEIDDIECTLDLLKLKTNISTTNMVLFDAECKLKKYSDIEEIVNDFCVKRLYYYGVRRAEMIKDIKYKLLVLENKHRFITEVIDDIIVINKEKQEKIIAILKERKYVDIENDGKFSELLGIRIDNFTIEKINKIEDEIAKLKDEMLYLENSSDRDLWLKDLEKLENEL